jgi:ferredoxin
MRVSVIEDKCCGYAACLAVAPRVFDIASDNIAVVLAPEPQGALVNEALAAVAACPTKAIVCAE